MVKIVVNIPFVVWRDGRPRYVATPAHRKLGFKGEDLRHMAGAWYTLDEAGAWSARRSAEVEERRKDVATARAGRRRIPSMPAANVYTIGQMIKDWQDPTKNPRFGLTEVVKGKRRIKPLSTNTRTFYRLMGNALASFDDGTPWAAPATQLTRTAARGIYERLAEERGPATARGVIAALSAAWSWAHNAGKVGPSPLAKLGMEAIDPRLRVGSVEEMRALIAAADAIGRREIGDAVMMGLMTGQRQKDRLLLVDGRDLDGRLLFRQRKTNAVVLVPTAPQLVERLAASRLRRQGHKIQHPELIIDETARRPFKSDWYKHKFAEVRAAAVAGIRNETGWMVEPCPSLVDFRDQDLRDTAVTWMALAGATIPEIISVTGHSEQSATQILKHYLGRHPEMAASAVGKAAKWLEGKGGL